MKMKVYFNSILMVLLGAIGFQSCDNDDNQPTVPSELQEAFWEKYPSATHVEWETKSGYYVADFYDNNYDASAWFSPDGIWHMTKTDIRYTALPEAVKSAFEQGEYSGWTVDDVDKLERKGIETVYVIEVELRSQGQEMDLYYSAEGLFIKAVSDTGNGDEIYLPATQIPETIFNFINEKYPDARLVETEVEHGVIKIEIIHGGYCKELSFKMDGFWISTSWDIHRNELPAVIIQALAESQYSSYTIDDIEYFEMPVGDFYVFELEMGEKEVKGIVDSTGNIV